MGSVPHRIFTWIERTAVPAFSESRAGNRPDLVGEGNHDFTPVCRNFPAKVTYPSHLYVFGMSRCDKLAEPGTAMIAVMQSDLVRRHRLTVEEYLRMAEIGLLAPEARVELIEGEIFDMAPTGHEHGGFTAWLHRRLLRDLGESISVWDQVTLPLDRFSAPEPDLAILQYRKDEYRGKRPSPDDVLLIVEVSQSSLRHDQKVKLPLYARHNIPEVWILDVQRLQIQFFHTAEAGHYTHTSSTSTPGRITLRALPGAPVDLTGLFED